MDIESKEVFGWLDDCDELCLKVQGSSMRPFLCPGRDSVILRRAENFRRGDIVVFERGGFYIMHRIIRIGSGVFTAMGDNRSHPEENIPVEKIVARASGAVRNGKKITESSAVWRFYKLVWSIPIVKNVVRKILSRR